MSAVLWYMSFVRKTIVFCWLTIATNHIIVDAVYFIIDI